MYKENRQRSKKKFKYLECIDFINCVNDKLKREHWSIDSSIGHSKLNRLFPSNKMICTKTYYNYIELGLLDIKNIDLPLCFFNSKSNERHNGMLRSFIKKGKAISYYDGIIYIKLNFSYIAT